MFPFLLFEKKDYNKRRDLLVEGSMTLPLTIDKVAFITLSIRPLIDTVAVPQTVLHLTSETTAIAPNIESVAILFTVAEFTLVNISFWADYSSSSMKLVILEPSFED
jgi:hypothetical protein